jgi:DinB family protein
MRAEADMRHVPTLFPIVLAAALAGAAAARAQTPKPDPTMRDMLLARWSEIGEKVVKMAEDFPEDKYQFRPVAEVRTFADQLRHVAFWNQYVAKTARGEKIDPAINELPAKEFPTKAAIVAALKQSLADATAALKGGPADLPAKKAALWVTFTEHTGEHYGQLVVYFRLNGIVPPASRSGG